jgi:DNA repair protein RadC
LSGQKQYQPGNSIKNWSEDDRPREKLLYKGRHVLSDAELIGILISSGTKNRSAVEVAKDLLTEADYDLNKLSRLSVKQLMKVPGIGQARAVTITAALELGRRRKESSQNKKAVITSSKDVYDYFYPHLVDLNHEMFYVLLLKRNSEVICHKAVSAGGVSGTVVDPKLIFKDALEETASSIILCHNHPSGNLKPSKADISITEKLKNAGNFLDINVLDHIIFTNQHYFSFADEGMM